MAEYFWMGGTDSLSSKYQNWSASSGGSPLASWPGTSPDASDNFIFDESSAVNCTWESSVVSMTNASSIQQSLTARYTGVLTISITTVLQGLILNGEITDGGASSIIKFTGSPLATFNDADGKKRYVLNGQFAKHTTGSDLTYQISPNLAAVCLDNGPYNNLISDTYGLELAYNIPTATVHDHADNNTIHIKGSYNAASTGGFQRSNPPDASKATKVAIKFDDPSFTYSATTLDFKMATAFFRGIEIPVTGTPTYGTTAGFTVRHYGVIIFAASNGDTATIRNGTQLDCYSLEIKAGANVRVQSDGGEPAIIKTQTEPQIAGIWSFESLSSHTFTSPRNNPVTSVANGGTGRTNVAANNLLMGNAAGAMQGLSVIAPGTNTHVLTMVGGVPAWAAGGGGGGGSGTVTSITAGTGLDGGTITTSGTIDIANTSVSAGSYTNADITVDAQGRLTAAANGSAATSFTTLTDTPANYTGAAGFVLKVNALGTGIEFVDMATQLASVSVRDEGVGVGVVPTINFVGAGVTATLPNPTQVDITIPGGGGGGGTTALITSTNVATCPGPGGVITTTGDSRQIAYINGDPGTPIAVTDPTADGIRLTIISLTGFGSGSPSALAFVSPVLSTVNGLSVNGALDSFSSAELIWKTNSLIDPTGDPGESPVSGWHLVSTQNFRMFNQGGLVI